MKGNPPPDQPMSERSSALTPEALEMMDCIARTGSFAGAARELGKVPSALTYNVRKLEEALDVLLFDRGSRQATLTAAGEELLAEGRRLLAQMDAVANRVQRVATGWETHLTIAVDTVISNLTCLELCEAFYANAQSTGGAVTRLRLRHEVLAGTLDALLQGEADLAIGVGSAYPLATDTVYEPLGELAFVFAVAPHHPLAGAKAPITDAELVLHRAVAVADSAQRLSRLTFNLLPGQDVLTVDSMRAKIEAQIRGLVCGYLPEPMARCHVNAGHLVVKPVERGRPAITLGYAWRAMPGRSDQDAPLGQALRWWLHQLRRPATRVALLERYAGGLSD